MTFCQGIVLYFIIFKLVGIFIHKVVKSYNEKQKAFKRQIWNFRIAYRRQNEKYEKEDFLFRTKNGLPTDIDKTKINNVA